MKHKRLKLSALLFLGLGLTGLQAQTSVNATGGNASGSGGSASYSVGQLAYTTNTGTNGSVSEGVQQPFEISVVTGIEEAKDIFLNVSAYPNPTTDYLELKVENLQLSELSYKLYDISGKVYQNKEIGNSITKIEMQNLPQGIYFIKVIDTKNKEFKTFKIIKN
ncbi:MAG: T9SS type A sorting domain-containing protein [Bacteroidales bacterium]|jgi:hypothetical protein